MSLLMDALRKAERAKHAATLPAGEEKAPLSPDSATPLNVDFSPNAEPASIPISAPLGLPASPDSLLSLRLENQDAVTDHSGSPKRVENPKTSDHRVPQMRDIGLRTIHMVCEQADNKADVVPCDRLPDAGSSGPSAPEAASVAEPAEAEEIIILPAELQPPVVSALKPVPASPPEPPPLPPKPTEASPSPAVDENRRLAKAAFAAKKPGITDLLKNRRLLWGALAGVLFLVGGGLTFYLWQVMGGGAGALVTSQSPALVASAPIQEQEAVESSEIGASLKVSEATSAAPPVGEAQPPAPVAPPAASAGPAPPGQTSLLIPSASTKKNAKKTGERKSALPGKAAAEPPASPFLIKRRVTAAALAPLLKEAYEAYQAGDYPKAESGYRQALKLNALHRGATLGLAAIALQKNEPAQARALYAQLLDRDPNDPLAHAGLLSLAASPGESGRESQVKELLAVHPAVAALHLALGNLYAAQERWAEAQQAYFNAVEADQQTAPGRHSAAYPFNLAVSLERLGKPTQALGYYRKALALAQRFDGADAPVNRSLIEQRITALTGESR